LINLVVEQKLLVGILKWIWKNDFENVGIGSYSIEELSKMNFENEMGDEYPRVGGMRIL
jgi:hypothetical protein